MEKCIQNIIHYNYYRKLIILRSCCITQIILVPQGVLLQRRWHSSYKKHLSLYNLYVLLVSLQINWVSLSLYVLLFICRKFSTTYIFHKIYNYKLSLIPCLQKFGFLSSYSFNAYPLNLLV